MVENKKPSDKDALAQRLDPGIALEAAGLGVWEFDPATNRVQWDERCADLFGVRQANPFAYEDTLHYVHPDDKDRVNQAIQWAMNPASGGHYDLTYRTLGDDGRARWIRSMGRSYFDGAGRATRFTGVARDVTELMQNRQKLEAAQQRVLSSFEQAPVGIAVISEDNLTFRMANPFYGRLVDRTPEQLIGKPMMEALPELAGQGFDDLLRGVMATGQPYTANEVGANLVRQGQLETIYVDLTYQPQREADGTVSGVLVVAVDVTQQVTARRKLEESEARFRTLVEEAPVATCLFVGRELRIDLANEAMIQVWGKGPGVIGMPLAQALPELAGQPFLPLLDELFTTGNTYSAKGGRADLVVGGTLQTFYFDYDFKPLRAADDTVYAILETAVDVTQQVTARRKIEESEARYRLLAAQLEEQVQQRTEELEATNEELAATNEELRATNEEYAAINEELTESTGLLLRSNDNLQKFAYVASHDLQEPLRKIQQFGDILKHQYRDQLGDGVTYLERMQSAASRMSTLIRDLLSYSRIATQRDQQEPVSLRAVLDTVLNDLELVVAETKAQITVGPLPTVAGDALQLGQLFQNLLSNALKFRRPGVVPHIEVSAHTVDSADLPPAIKPARATKQYHRIDVADNGVGFDEKYLDRIFQVFQRLHGRSEYGGTGIGLAICEKVVANHGGAITATSRPGQGATFRVYLPV